MGKEASPMPTNTTNRNQPTNATRAATYTTGVTDVCMTWFVALRAQGTLGVAQVTADAAGSSVVLYAIWSKGTAA